MVSGSRMLDSGRLHLARWALAAVIVLGAHVGGLALTLLSWEDPPELEDAGGTVVLELAPIAAVAPVDTPDLAHGPLMEEAAPAVQASEQKLQEVPKEIPKVEPSPAPEPEVALPMPQPEQKDPPKEEEAKEAVPEPETQQQANEAPLTTAPPRVEAQPSPNAAPTPGRAASLANAQASWQKALVDHLNRFKRYPVSARSQRVQGTVVVAFKIDRSGHLMNSHVVRSSGSAVLDGEALAVLKRSEPVPAPPGDVEGRMLDLILPIQFKIR
jgi:protein TonB